MSGLIGGGIGLLGSLFGSGAIGGSSAKTDRGTTLNAYKDLNNTYNWALPFAKSETAAGQGDVSKGMGDLGAAGSYYKKLLSGSRPEALQAVAPETKSVMDQSDAAKRQLAASGTARGGGVSASNQQRDTDTMAKVDQLLFGVRPAAAAGAERVGGTESQVGLGETQAGIQSAMLGEYAASDLGKLSAASRRDSYNIHKETVDSITQAIGTIFTEIPGLKDLKV